MAEPTVTLASIRRTLCRELKMPFFRRFADGYLVADSGGSTTTLIDATLTQPENFWKGSWLYRIASQEVSWITRFSTRENKATLETPITAIAAADQYEIHTGWNAFEIKEAINKAIRNARRAFPDSVTDETLVVQEDVRKYDLTGLTTAPWLIHRVWIEQPRTIRRGTVVSATASTVTLESSGLLSDVDTDWMISIYAGTGKGQLRTVASVSGAQIDGLSSNWTTTPDSTSKYALWNANDETHDWYPFDSLRSDAKEFPSYIYFSTRPVDFYGLRMRIEYSAYAGTLSAEADTTIVPLEYLEPAALSYLHEMRIRDTKADRDLHFGEWRRYADEADKYLLRNAPHIKDTIIWTNPEHMYQPDTNNPLNW